MPGEFLYNNIIMPLAGPGFRLAALWNEKARAGVEGRSNWAEKLAAQLENTPPKRVVLHAPSVGEFLQGRAVLDLLLDKHPDMAAVVTHFSPSAEKITGAYKRAAAHGFLPLDTKKNARRFFDIINPVFMAFSRADVWPNFAEEAARRGIPAVLVAGSLSGSFSGSLSGSFSDKGFKPLVRPGGLMNAAQRFSRRGLKHLDFIAAVSEDDASLFIENGVVDETIIEITGDPRYDQAWDRARSVDKSDELFKLFSRQRRDWTIVAGSTWPQDERVFLPAFAKILKIHPEVKIIIAPHEPLPGRIGEIKRALEAFGIEHATLSDLETRGLNPLSATLIDRVGVLGKLYLLGKVAFVGGSFVSRVHNVMEPACFGLPVIVGPHHRNSREALTMIKAQGCFIGAGEKELIEVIERFINDEDFRVQSGKNAMDVVDSGRGAAARTVEAILNRFPEIFPA